MTNKTRILAVDDEALNLEILLEYFADESALSLDTADGGEAAWALLQNPENDYKAILLDRMMPGLDGIGLLKRIKGDARLAGIPVIMQTAANSAAQIREGLEAGAYYYLTKPYEPEALISIVRVAMEDRRARSQLRTRAARLEEAQKLISTVEYRFVTMDDITSLVPVLASMCPVPDVVAPGLSDLMVNAVEHGNLATTYQEKSSLKWEGDWEGEINRRLSLPEYCDRFATIRLERDAGSVVFTITDQGDGFDWHKFLTFDPERAFDPNGRGIAMAKMMSFSSLEYIGNGNVVVATVATV